MGFSDPAYPIDAAALLEAKTRGLNKMNAADVLERNLPLRDHNAILQGVMSQTSKQYIPGCWRRGVCCKEKKDRDRHETLHRTFVRGIKQGIERMIPKALTKDYLTSGDLVVAVRFPAFPKDEGSSGEPSSDCNKRATATAEKLEDEKSTVTKVFAVPKVTLRPEGAVLVAMDLDRDVGSSKGNIYQATLRRNDRTGLEFCHSTELCADLLNLESPGLNKPLWLQVLEYKRLSLGITSRDAGDQRFCFGICLLGLFGHNLNQT